MSTLTQQVGSSVATESISILSDMFSTRPKRAMSFAWFGTISFIPIGWMNHRRVEDMKKFKKGNVILRADSPAKERELLMRGFEEMKPAEKKKKKAASSKRSEEHTSELQSRENLV